MNKFETLNIFTNPQPIPSLFNEGFSQYETITKLISIVNGLINDMNYGSDEIEFLKKEIENIIDLGYIPNTPNYSLSPLEKNFLYGVGMSYFENAWATINQSLTYGNSKTPLDNNTSYTQLDCSSFIILCLMGIDYFNSPFNGKALNYQGKIGFSRQFINTNKNSSGLIRYAYEIALYGKINNLLFEPTKITDYQTGDIVFFNWSDEYYKNVLPTDWEYDNYGHIAHVGMIVENCSKFKDGLGLLHCVNTSALMQLREFETYAESTENLELYPYVLRPKINIDNYNINGYWRFRGLKGCDNLYLNKQGYSYSGGLTPNNMVSKFVNKSTGVETDDLSRLLTDFIPYSKALFVVNDVNGIGYHVCFYDGNKNFLGYSQNSTTAPTGSKLVKVEFYNLNGAITDLQKSQILNNRIVYHDYADIEKNLENSLNSNLYDVDTIKYFSDVCKVENNITVSMK